MAEHTVFRPVVLLARAISADYAVCVFVWVVGCGIMASMHGLVMAQTISIWIGSGEWRVRDGLVAWEDPGAAAESVWDVSIIQQCVIH